MGRTWIAHSISAVVLTACLSGVSTSRAEQVDVPVKVRLRFAPETGVACRKDRCRIHFSASVASDSEDGVWARNCSATVLDSDGDVVAMKAFEFGPPAGVYTRRGTVSRVNGGLDIKIARPRRDRIRALRATCLAYVWHGEPPI